MASANKNDSWAKYGLKIAVSVILLLAMFVLGRVNVAQDKANNRIGQLEQRVSSEEAKSEVITAQLQRIEDKVDRILEGQ